ncbi:MAG: hypothetical protein KIT17_00655 [Rubrivivax sp.]|nr:hypothetical protein [Rubrivivax sp.]
MDTMAQAPSTRAARRRHDDDLKRRVLDECRQPGASVAKVALAHGLNANLALTVCAHRRSGPDLPAYGAIGATASYLGRGCVGAPMGKPRTVHHALMMTLRAHTGRRLAHRLHTSDNEQETVPSLQNLMEAVRAAVATKAQRNPPPAATGIAGAARYVNVSVRKFKAMEAIGLMPAGRATSSRSYLWLYTELDAALAALPKKTPRKGEPARLAAGKQASKVRKRGTAVGDREVAAG